MQKSCFMYFLTVFGMNRTYWRVVYCLVFFATSYSFGMILKNVSNWGYFNPLIIMAWLSIVPGLIVCWRMDSRS